MYGVMTGNGPDREALWNTDAGWGAPRSSSPTAAPDPSIRGTSSLPWNQAPDVPTQPTRAMRFEDWEPAIDAGSAPPLARKRPTPGSPLIATRRQRRAYRHASRPFKVFTVVLALACLAGACWAGREPLSAALEQARTAPQPAAAPTPSPTALPVDQNELAEARNTLQQAIDDALAAKSGALPGAEMNELDRLLGIAHEVIQGEEPAKMTTLAQSLRDAAAALPRPASTDTPVNVAPAPQDTPQPVQQPVTPTPTEPSTAASVSSEAAGSVMCTEAHDITFHATGQGTVTLTGGGQETTGDGAADLTLSIGDGAIASVRATAQEDVTLTADVDGSTCRLVS